MYVRRYPVAADAEGNLSLVLFRCAQDALLVDSWLGSTGRVRHIAENVSFTMCSLPLPLPLRLPLTLTLPEPLPLSLPYPQTRKEPYPKPHP